MALDSSNTRPKPDGLARIDKAAARRNKMTEMAVSRPLRHIASNVEELTYSVSQPTNFTKGLPHDAYGLVERSEYDAFVADLVSPNPKMDSATKVGEGDPNYRKWESPLAGHYYEIEGPDPAHFSMAPAPKLGGSELCFEIASVYVMSLLRDCHFGDLDDPSFEPGFTYPAGYSDTNKAGKRATMQDIVHELKKLSWANRSRKTHGFYPEGLTAHEKRRRSAIWNESGELTVATLFRGSTTGAKQGPYLSQFLLLGTKDRRGSSDGVRNGVITYGAQTIDQRILRNTPNVDFMQSWEEWLDVQNGAAKEFNAADWSGAGLLQTPRDLSTFVHYDQLYQAYLNAGMMLDAHGAAVDEGAPINKTRGNSSKGFATWGGPHMLSLVTEVATRALRAVRRQKFQIHRRARPEVLAARLTQVHVGEVGRMDVAAVKKVQSMLQELGANDYEDDSRPGVLLHWINERNGSSVTINGNSHPSGNLLLPMAFPEGSPMHPAYGAGHATVAGACVTVLKAFYASDLKMKDLFGLDHFYEANANANGLRQAGHLDSDVLVSEELDKLAANIAIGRNFAGVHYYTDYYDSLRLGERIAAGILEEQMLTYNEPVKLSFRDFDGHRVEIAYTGEENDKPVLSYYGSGDWWLRPVEEFVPTQTT